MRLPPAVLSLLLLVELPFLGRAPLVRDEATTIEVAQRHWGAFWELLQHLDAPLGLYYLLLRPVVAVSDGAFAVRLPSLVGVVVAVAVLITTAERRFGRRVAVWSGVVLLANPGLWLFAAFARPYALALAMAALTLYVLLVAPHRTVLYGVAALLTVYLQLLFGLFLVAQAVLLVRRREVRLLVALTVAGVAALPLAFVASGQSVMTRWIPYTSPTSLKDEAFELFGSTGALSTVAAVLCVGLVLAGLRLPPARWVVLLGAVPTAVIVVAGVRVHLLGARYVLYLLLVLALAAGLGLAAVRSRPAQAAIAVVLGLTVLASAVHFARRDYGQEDLRAAAAYLSGHDLAGDALLYDPDWARPGMAYWLAKTDGPKPDDLAVRPGTVPAETGNLFLPETSTAELERALNARTRVWVVGYPGQTWRPTRNTSGDVATALAKTWMPRQHVSFGQIELRLLERPAPLA